MIGTAGTARRRIAARWGALAACALFAAAANAQFIMKDLPEPVRGLDIVEHVGDTVPLDTELVNSEGKSVTLGDYFNQGKPVILELAYYDCPVACPAVMQSMARCFNGLDHTVGKDFNVVVVSFNPKNTTMMAARTKAETLPQYERPKTPEVAAGWEFHTATAEASSKLAEAVGFQYRRVPDSDEYSHPIGIFVLTPAGKISRYFYGFDLQPQDMKLALFEASEGKMARTLGDRLLQFCYHYNPKTGTYTFAAYRLMQVGAILTFVLLVVLVAFLKSSEARRRKRSGAPRPADPAFPVNLPPAALGPSVATQR